MVASKIARAHSRTKQRGLTLVELLVVITILALASSVVLLTAPPMRPAAREDAARFAARLQSALDYAVVNASGLRVSIDSAGYQFESEIDGEWRASELPGSLQRQDFDNGTTASVSVEDAANDNLVALGQDSDDVAEADDADVAAQKAGVVSIALDPLAAQTPFVVKFSSRDGAWTVAVDGGAGVKVEDDGRKG